MPDDMSNSKEDKVQFKVEMPARTRDLLRDASDATGYPMSMIIRLLVEYNLQTLDIDRELRKALKSFAAKHRTELKLTARQKKVIENVVGDSFTKDLI